MKKIINILCLILLGANIFAQGIPVKGVVKDTKGQPVIGAAVMLKGSSTVGAVTDVNGAYSLVIPSGTNAPSLVATCIGYKEVTVPVGKNNVIDITIEEDSEQLEEVVVVGYGTMRKSDLTGSVTSVKIDEEEAARSTSFDQLLTGRAAGVQISTAAGTDAGVNIRVRGTSTLTGSSEPLYVVDGVILSTATTSMLSVDRTDSYGTDEAVNPLMSINPQDIESIEILKDASATAIYGSEGANGVILITTKTSKKEKPVIRFSAGVDLVTMAKKLDVLSFDRYADFLDEAYYHNDEYGYTASALDKRRDALYDDPDTRTGLKVIPVDWQDYTFRNTVRERYFFSVSGKPNTVAYNFSVGYNNSRGLVRGTGTKQYTVRLNVDKHITPNLSIGTKINAAHINSDLPWGASNYKQTSGTSIIRSILTSRPYVADVSDDDDDDDTELAMKSTPLRWLDGSTNRRYEFQVTPNAYLQWKIVPWLTYKLSLNADYHMTERTKFRNRALSSSGSLGANAQIASGESIRWNMDNLLMVNKTFNGGHTLSGTLGVTLDNRYIHNQQLMGYNIEQENFREAAINSAPNTMTAYSETKTTLLSYFIRAIYNYKDRYVITGTFRADGCSKFSPGNKYSFFPSFAGAWRINEEPWFNVRTISAAKLRVGWGRVGNSAVSAYQTFSTFSRSRLGNADPANDAGYDVGLAPDNMAQPDLRWETTEQWNAGLDISLWNGRLAFTADAYYKTTYDLLNRKYIPYSSGFERIWVNQGSIINKGLEFTIDATPVAIGDFEWNLNANLSLNRNRIRNIGTDSEGREIYFTPTPDGKKSCNYYFGATIGSGNYGVEPLNIFIEGQPIGLFYGYATDGIVQAGETGPQFGSVYNGPGGIRFKDPNGDGKVESSERTIIGDPNPDFTFGFGTTFRWKHLTFSAHFNGSYGNDVCNHNNMILWNTSNTAFQNVVEKAVSKAWSPRNTGGTMPRLNSGVDMNNYFLDSYIEDGSYIRLSNLSLSYLIPFKSTKTRKAVLKNMNVGVSVGNVFVWTRYSGFDPDTNSYSYDMTRIGIDSGSSPASRTYGLDIKFTF